MLGGAHFELVVEVDDDLEGVHEVVRRGRKEEDIIF